MGPVMNLVLAVVLLAVVLMQGADVLGVSRSARPWSAWCKPDSPAEQAGIQPGDMVVKSAPPTSHLGRARHGRRVAARARRAVRGAARRARRASDGASRPHRVAHARQHASRSARSACCPTSIPAIEAVFPGDPADKAGLKPGDVIVAIDGERMVFAIASVRGASRSIRDQPIQIVVRRDGAEHDHHGDARTGRATTARSASHQRSDALVHARRRSRRSA